MKWLLALTMLLLVPAAMPAPVAGFDYDSCVKSGTGTSMERMGTKAWQNTFDLSSRRITCAGADADAKRSEIRRRERENAQLEQLSREILERGIQEQEAKRSRDQQIRANEQRQYERQMRQDQAELDAYRQEQADRAREKAWQCARSGACSTTRDIQEQIDRSKREAETPPR